jgi:hypothetical protein
MARLPQLIDAISKTSGRDRSSVEHWARAIREAGLITTTKRGVGAAEMTTRDAANLIIAANAAENTKEALQAVPQFRDLETWYSTSETQAFEGVFARLKDAPTFGEALEELIEGVPELILSFGQYLEEAYGDKAALMSDPSNAVRLVVELGRWPATASIRIERYNQGWIADYSFEFIANMEQVKAGQYLDPPDGCDRRTTVRFGLKTVFRAWATLNGEPEECPAGGQATP